MNTSDNIILNNNIVLNNTIVDISDNIVLNTIIDVSNNSIVDVSNNSIVLDTIVDVSDNIITTLCFSSGGIKGLSFLGVLKKLEKNNIINLNNIKLYVGTSIGSLLGFLLNIGYSIEEIETFVLLFDFKKFVSEVNCIDFLNNCGIDNGEKFIFIITKLLEFKLNRTDITFKELYELTNKKLIIIGTNLTKLLEKEFNYETTPSCSILKAIRISCSIPIVFTPVQYEDDIYVDGALCNTFPMNYCNDKNTIGIYIKNGNTNFVLDSIKDMIFQCMAMVSNTMSEKYITTNKNVIVLDNFEGGLIDFNMPCETKKKIIKTGNKFGKEFVKSYKK